MATNANQQPKGSKKRKGKENKKQVKSSVPEDPLALLTRKLEESRALNNPKQTQAIRTLMWKVSDLKVEGKELEIQALLIEGGIIEGNKIDLNLSKPGGSSHLDSTDKDLQKIDKKLKDIIKIKAKLDSGEKVEENQKIKIEKEAELLKEREDIEKIIEKVKSETLNIDEQFLIK